MSEMLPLFPLSAVLFPDMLMPLHIFEPRYRVLVRRSLAQDEPFGVVLLRSGSETAGGGKPHRVGTTASIVGHTPLPDGRSFIVVRGGRRFAIASLVTDQEPYLVAHVDHLADDDGSDAEELADRAAEAFAEYVHAAQTAAGEESADAPAFRGIREGTPRDVAFRVAAGLAIEAEERQRLLEAPSTRERLTSALHLLARENVLLKELLVRLRASGHRARLN